MARPTLLLTGAGYYQRGYLEEHWPRLLERCEVRLTDARDGPELLAQIAEADVLIPRRVDIRREALEAAARPRWARADLEHARHGAGRQDDRHRRIRADRQVGGRVRARLQDDRPGLRPL